MARHARHVSIDSERARHYPIADHRLIEDPAYRRVGDDETTARFVLALNAVNFGSGWFAHFPGGYLAVARAMAHYRADAHELAHVSERDIAGVLALDVAEPNQRELTGLYTRALNDLGRELVARYGGSARAFVEAADHSAEQLARQLLAMAFYRDRSTYQQKEIAFYKRAQIASLDLSRALADSPLGRFDDLHRLTVFADNLLPHVLRTDGVLRYDAALGARIDAGEPLVAGSPEEIELRACTVHACELIARAGAITEAELDTMLWQRGHEPRYQTTPPHRTKTVWY